MDKINICFGRRNEGEIYIKNEMKKKLEEKIKLNLYMSIYNTEELINLLKEYHCKFGCDADIKKDVLYDFMAIKELQSETFNSLMSKEDKGYGNN